MYKKPVSHFEKRGDRIEKRFQTLRNEIEKDLRPLIKKWVLSLKHDCWNTQHSFYLTDTEKQGERFDKLNDFLARCSDDFRIDPYFKVENGKFKWLD